MWYAGFIVFVDKIRDDPSYQKSTGPKSGFLFDWGQGFWSFSSDFTGQLAQDRQDSNPSTVVKKQQNGAA
mgnify:CR=1 FL=1